MEPINITEIKIRGYHLDMFGHVNNARYLEFFEEGRWSFMDEFPQIYMMLQQEKVDPIVVKNEIDYKSSAQFGDVIEVRTYLDRFSSKSAAFHQIIINKKSQKEMVEAYVTFVLKSKETGKAIEIPEGFRKLEMKK